MKKNLLIYGFFIMLLGISILDIISPETTFSELENRYLNKKTKFTLKSYFDGSFSKKYENYLNDQFIGRDNWINLKSSTEYVLGKTENNNILYGNKYFLFEKVTSIDEKRENLNISAVNIFAQNCDMPVSVMIVPNSYIVYKEYLPHYAPIINGEHEIEKIYNKIENTDNISLINVMNDRKEKLNEGDFLYYRTDHHWTVEGAYEGYTEYIKSIGMEPVNLKYYEKNSVPGFLGTYYSKSKPIKYKYDTITYYDFDNVTMEIGEEEYHGLYDVSKAEVNDKYSLFLYGNNPLSIIKNNEINSQEKLLVIKDSYGNSFVPFLSQNFKEIHVIDLRSYNGKISKYVERNKFDRVLILYNFTTFLRDSDLVKLKY